MGLEKKKETTDYWITKFGCLISAPYFGSVMFCNKHQLISKFRNCFDNSRPKAGNRKMILYTNSGCMVLVAWNMCLENSSLLVRALLA